jgi:hypothetical protein
MTLRYAHLSPSHKVAAVKVLDQALNEGATLQLPYNFQKEKGSANC